jgi:hypothetical protein
MKEREGERERERNEKFHLTSFAPLQAQKHFGKKTRNFKSLL